MNQHVMRPDQSERTEYGLTLTDAQPLSGIPALWRLAALLATLLMGALALIAALLFRPLDPAPRGGGADRRHHARAGGEIRLAPRPSRSRSRRCWS